MNQILTTIDQWIMIAYLLGMVGVGLYASSKVHSASDYAVAGRSLNLPLLSGTLIGSAIGASATFGKAGKAYEVGFIVLFSSLAYIFGYLVFAWLGPRLRAMKIDTVPDALQRRYGTPMRSIAAAILLLAVITTFGAQLIAFGIMASSVLSDLGVSYEQAVIGAALVIVIYTLIGGLLAVAYTDLAQVVIMVISVGLILPICLYINTSGTNVDLLALPVSDPWLALDWKYLLAFIPTYMAFVIIDPSIWQRAAAAKHAEDLRPAMLTTSGVYALWSLVVVTLGVVAFNLHPELASGDESLPTLILNHLPPVAKGLCLSAVMAIMMSTADSALLIAGTTFSGDLLKPIRPKTTDRQQLMVTRIVILAIGVVGALFALEKAPIFDVMMLSLAIFVTGLFVPVMAALFWNGATANGAMAAAIVGTSTQLALYWLRSREIFDLGVEPILVAFTFSVIALWAVSRWDRSRGVATTPALVV